MKRNYMSVLLLIIMALSMYAIENEEDLYAPYFSYPGIENGIDPLTGNRVLAPGGYFNFYNRNKLKLVEITRFKYGKEELNEFIRQEYRNGLVASGYSKYYEEKYNIYKYDSLRRITQTGGLWSYKYYAETPNKQEIYYQNTQSSTNTVILFPDGYEIKATNNNSSNSSRTIKENALIVKIIQSKDGKERAWYDFSYENGLLKKIINALVSKDDIRQITTIKKYEGKNIAEIETLYFRKGLLDFTNTYYLSDYDKYGNWHTLKLYRNGQLIEKDERKIDYTD